ncbi:MAG TPA: MaoC family dehydratase [Vicinamibacterales bacterium]
MKAIDVRTLKDHVGRELGVSDWLEISQARINQFAEATGDHQWIHVDAAKAATESPFKTTIAHGFLTLSLISLLLRSALTFEGARMAINYGLNRVRFVSPVPSGSRVRGRFTLASVEDAGGAIQAVWSVTVEREGTEKPSCVAEWLVRYYPSGL